MTATRLPVRSTPWSHCAEWKAAPAEFVLALDIGNQRDVQCTRAGDQELCDVLLPIGGEHVPAVFGVVPVGAIDERVEPDVAAQPVLLGDALEVVPDLGLRREQRAPCRFRLERERVQVRRHVTRAARVAVVPPGATDVPGLLQDQEVHALLLQRDAHPQSGEAGPDDQRAGVHGLLGRALGRVFGDGHEALSPTFVWAHPGTAVPGTSAFSGYIRFGAPSREPARCR